MHCLLQFVSFVTSNMEATRGLLEACISALRTTSPLQQGLRRQPQDMPAWVLLLFLRSNNYSSHIFRSSWHVKYDCI